MKREIFLASDNPGKLQEFREMLFPLGYLVYSPKDLNLDVKVDETGETYRENAYLKAKAYAEVSPFPVIADDSGLEVTALNHQPGIHTARFAHSKGGFAPAMDDILEQIKNKQDRSAQFVCCICYLEKKGEKPLYFEGICPGEILPRPVGGNGFGFDPIFHCTEGDCDFGLANKDLKNQYSHRGIALRKLKLFLIL